MSISSFFSFDWQPFMQPPYKLAKWARCFSRCCSASSSAGDNFPDIILPKTTFNSRCSVEEEALIYRDQVQRVYVPQQFAEDSGSVEEAFDGTGRKRKRFVLLDGPPYANGVLHMGHFLNKTLKDMVLRYKMLRGYSVRY